MNLNDILYVLPRFIRGNINGRPLNSSTEIRLTRLCTQRCRQCSVYERKTQPPSMSLESFKIIAQRLRDYGAFVGFISGGEPTLVPHLDRILIEAKRTFRLATTLVTGLVNDTPIIRSIARMALDNDINIQTSLDGLGEVGDDLRGVHNYSKKVLDHMAWIADHRGNSKSLLYANIVMNNKNLHQIPDLIKKANDIGWKTTVGLYHSLTATTRVDDDLRIVPGEELENVIRFLEGNPNILNLEAFIAGIPRFIRDRQTDICAFTQTPVLATRITIMENGDVHLCWGNPVGNISEETLQDIFTGQCYRERIAEYRQCRGCWTTCYTQRYLLTHPRSPKELLQNIKKVRKLRK